MTLCLLISRLPGFAEALSQMLTPVSMPMLLEVVAFVFADFETSTYFMKQQTQRVGDSTVSSSLFKIPTIANFPSVEAQNQAIHLRPLNLF